VLSLETVMSLDRDAVFSLETVMEASKSHCGMSAQLYRGKPQKATTYSSTS